QTSGRGSNGDCARLKRCAVAQERPDNARHLGGQGDDDRIGMRSCKQAAQPLSEPRVASAQGRQGPSTLDQHLPKVFAAWVGDAEQARFASCRRRRRAKSKPGGKIATPCESLCITDRRDKRSCVKRTNSGNAR